MGISKDLSVVADSELASSPRPSAFSPAPLKRAPRTYGRRREDPDNSFTSEHDSSSSIYRTGPPNLSDEIPPSDPSGLVDSDDGEEDDDADILPPSLLQPRIGFGWRAKMKEIDNKEDLSEYLTSKVVSVCASGQDLSSTTSAIMETHLDTPNKELSTELTTKPLSENVSGDSLSLSSPSQPTASQGCSRWTSALKASRNRPRAQKNIITSDDDMNELEERDSRPSSPRSSPPSLIATPISRRTSSPPTSHHDNGSVNSTSSSASKGKGEPLQAQKSVTSLPLSAQLEGATRPRSSLAQREKKQKVKPPTRKERQDLARERARLAAGQEVSIDKPVAVERSLQTLFKFVQDRYAIVSNPSPRRPDNLGDRLALEDSDSEGLPDVDAALRSLDGTRKPVTEGTSHAQELLQVKNQILKYQARNSLYASDDSDIEVVPPTRLERQRRSSEKKKLSRGQRMLLSNAQIRPKPVVLDPQEATKIDLDSLEATVLKQGTSNPVVLKTLLRQRAEKESLDIVRHKEEEWKRLGGTVKDQDARVPTDTDQREQIRKGLEVWGNSGKEVRLKDTDEGDGNEDEDPDWMPDTRGSKSPTSGFQSDEEINYEEMEMGEDEGDDEMDQEVDEGNSVTSHSDDEDEQLVAKARVKHHPRLNVVDSDGSDSGDLDGENLTVPKPRDNRYVVSSSDDRTEDENDKENNTRLMFDRSEDKENKAVARHEPLPSRSMFDDIDHDPSLSPPHILALNFGREEQDASHSTASPHEKRKPFGVISDASPLSLQCQPSTLTQALAAQLKHSSPTRGLIEDTREGDVFGSTPSASAASLEFAPIFGAGDKGKIEKSAPLGFSQFSQGRTSSVMSSMSFRAPALLKPGFSDLFESSTQKDDAGAPVQDLRRQGSLGLTQDLILQPAFQVDEKLLRKADVIFEKEQEYVVEAASKKGGKEPEFYINEVGLLTQTKPASRLGTRSPSFVLSPTQARVQWSETPSGFGSTQVQAQSQRRSSDPTQPRPPLRTISLSNPSLSSPEASPKHRLRKRRETPSLGRSPTRSPLITSSNTLITSSSPSPQPVNAFTLLKEGAARDGQAKGRDKDKLKGKSKEMELEKLVRAEWVVDEAEESDEDQMAGFGFVKKNGDSDEAEGTAGEDLDAPLKELVDDQKMDEETEAVDKVMEKHQELMEKDEEEALKFHQGVAQGEWRRKRKNRFGLDDSEEEDEEDERARRIRRKMREKAERGDIKELAANEKTAAFANVYQNGLVDDELIETRPLDLDLDFRSDREPRDEDVLMGDSQETLWEDGAEPNGDEEAEDSYVTYKEIQAKARDINEQPEDMNVPDYEDVSWIDQQEVDEGDSLKVQVVTVHPKKSAVPTTSTSFNTAKPVAEWESFMLGGARRKENEKDVARSRAWAKSEARNMTGSTGRLVGGIAITGLGNKAKNGGGSLRSKGSSVSTLSSASSSSSASKKTVKPEGSVLAGLGKRTFQ
ncbi:hypothetical protein AN958_07961 [Leucoagaricus sp. SymC.cos]|nr:hypothetical protein AN958_07961 [Leucoagaricus sp. SymC.cos]